MSVSGVEDSNPTAAYNLIPEDTLLAVFHAAEFGDLKALQDLFQQNLPPTQLINKEMTTPLHCATERGNYEIIKLLLETGANVNVGDKYGYTPLHYSNRNGHHLCSILLIDHGADTTIRNNNGETPLDVTEIFSLREAIHNEELQRYARIASARPIVISGTGSVEDGRFDGRYSPKYSQCGWPVYCHDASPSIRLSYFGDDHHGQWRIQDLHPPTSSASLDLVPIFKISLQAPVFPHELSTQYPTSYWLLRSPPDPTPSIWSMLVTQKEKYDIFPALKVEEAN